MVSMTSSMPSPSSTVWTRPASCGSIGSASSAVICSSSVSSPLRVLPSGDRILCQLLVQEGRAGLLARHFAGRQRHETRDHPGFHPRNGGERQATRLQPRGKDCRVLLAEQAGDRASVRKHRQVRSRKQGGARFAFVGDLVGFDDDRPGVLVGGACALRHGKHARIGHVHGSEQVGRAACRPSRFSRRCLRRSASLLLPRPACHRPPGRWLASLPAGSPRRRPAPRQRSPGKAKEGRKERARQRGHGAIATSQRAVSASRSRNGSRAG